MTATIERLTAAAYTVPTDQPEADGTAQWDSTTAVVVTVESEGATGIGYSYTHASAASLARSILADAVVGRDVDAIAGCAAAMDRATRNVGRTGIAACAISAVDSALWDLKARLAGRSLLDLFGAARDGAPIYGSGGFTTYDDATMVHQLRGWVDAGAAAVKIKIGQSFGSHEARDLDRVATAREAIGADVGLFVDANGGYSPAQARRVERRLRDFDVTWFEEPVTSDAPAELAVVRHSATIDIAAGEYSFRIKDARDLLDARAVDCLQIDVTRCGGPTVWFQMAALASSHGLSVSAHCAPALSAHVACATPNLRHIEYFHDHARLEPELFEGTIPVTDGRLIPRRDTPGNGLRLAEGAERFLVSDA